MSPLDTDIRSLFFLFFFLKETQKEADLKSVPWFQFTQHITAKRSGRRNHTEQTTKVRRCKKKSLEGQTDGLKPLSQKSKSAKWLSLICSHGSVVVLYCFTSYVRHRKGVTC